MSETCAKLICRIPLATSTGLLILAVWAAGCSGPRASEGGFDSDNPAAKLYAIHDAGEKRDTDSIPHLVQALEDDDPAVRMMAIEALDRVTGTRLGYNPYDTLPERRVAVNRWVQAVDEGQFD